MLSLFVCFVKDNIILDIAVVFGISMAMAGGWRTVLRRTTVMQLERTAKAMLIPDTTAISRRMLSFTKHTNNDNIYQH